MDLQSEGVRCWFVQEDMAMGVKILDTLDDALRTRQEMLPVLSDSSIASDWVEIEVNKALAEERKRGGTVVLPVRR